MTLALAARPGEEAACRLLALVGPPGSAKSTMVRLLAKDMAIDLAEWQVRRRGGGAGGAESGQEEPPGFCVRYRGVYAGRLAGLGRGRDGGGDIQ